MVVDPIVEVMAEEPEVSTVTRADVVIAELDTPAPAAPEVAVAAALAPSPPMMV
jgi:hypothetical protein